MRVRLNRCDPDQLRLLADDRLPATELTALEDHLEHCPECRETLDCLVGADQCLGAVRRYLGTESSELEDTSAAAVNSLDFLAPSDWPDSLGRLGSYEIIGVIGRGGMGLVLKAFDPALNRNVAIKVLAAPLATCGAARRRFLREARAAAAVVHEHVVSVYAVVETAGLPFLVMEYVPGRSLQDRLEAKGPLSLPEILRIGMQTAAGLAAAHAQGLVHRDVKPANILLENGVERVRLTDFGLARAAADAGLTQSGVVAGTPHYMAPEQARGEPADHRADLFSLGSTLYAMCTGYPPFRADNAIAVLRRVSDDRPRPLREVNPDVPNWLEAIIARLHAKDPAERFQTASEVADLLASCLAHVQQPLSVPLPGEVVAALQAARRGNRRVIRWLLAGPAIVALISVSLVVGLRQFRPLAAGSGSINPRHAATAANRAAEETWRGAEDLGQQIQEVRGRASSVDAELHRASQRLEHDAVSARARSLSDQARSLEQEILTLRPTGPQTSRVLLRSNQSKGDP